MKKDQISIEFSQTNSNLNHSDKRVLSKTNNLKSLFKKIRDYFAGNVTGISRDETIAKVIMKLLFCKIYDESYNTDSIKFYTQDNEKIHIFEKRIESIFSEVKNKYQGIFENNDKVDINGKDLLFVVSKLEQHSIIDTDRDVIADAFEELIGISFRGGEGQFFTPRNVVKLMVDVLNPLDGEKIIDPACGSGGFLIESFKYLKKNNSKNLMIHGIDKDQFLAKTALRYLTLVGNKNFNIFCENSLENHNKWSEKAKKNIKPGTFDVVLTNPPFGAKIPVYGEKLLEKYKLGHIWKKIKGTNKWKKTDKVVEKRPPQVLFIERCIDLLKDGGRMGIVLPEGVFGNPSERYIWEYINSTCSVFGIVSLSQETFQPSTHTKTSVLFLRKRRDNTKKMFMSIAQNIGHDKNGKTLYKKGTNELNDDIPAITEKFNNFLSDKKFTNDSLGFSLNSSKIKDNIYVPEYYNPKLPNKLKKLAKSDKYNIISIGDLVKNNIIEIRRGNEIGSINYGTGKIPFVRTSDIVNWEIKFDPIKSVSNEVYEQYKDLQDMKAEDILLVGDGTFLIGRSALITKNDLKIIIQSHLKKIRVLKKDFVDPHYLFYLLNTNIFQEQVKSKTFVQATISTIGNRLNEIDLPFSKDKVEIDNIVKRVKKIITTKSELKKEIIKMTNFNIRK